MNKLVQSLIAAGSGVNTYQKITTTLYDAVIADGGVIESQLKLTDKIKDLYSCTDKWSNIIDALDPDFGYKLEAGTLVYPLVNKVYNATRLGDFSQATTTKMPVLVKNTGKNYLICNNGYTNATALGQVTSDLEIIVLITPELGYLNRGIVAHTSLTKKTFRLTVTNPATKLHRLLFSVDGTNEISADQSTTFTPVGDKYWFRCTRNQTTGLISYYWAENVDYTVPTSWTACGSNTKTAGQLYQQSSVPIEIGTDTAGTAHPFIGKIYRALVYDATTLKADFNPNEIRPLTSHLTWTGSDGNTWTTRVSASSYMGGVCWQTHFQFDGVDDELVASISNSNVLSIIGRVKKVNTYIINQIITTSTIHTLGKSGTSTFARNNQSSTIVYKRDATKAYAENAMQYWLNNYVSDYYNPTYNNSDKIRYTFMKSYHNASPAYIYAKSKLSSFIASYNASEAQRIGIIGDSTSPMGFGFVRYIQSQLGGSGVGWSNINTGAYDDRVIVTTAGSWTDYSLDDMQANAVLWGISGSSRLGVAGCSAVLTPESSVRYNKLVVWYAKDPAYGTFSATVNGNTTTITTTGTAGLGRTEIDVTEGNYAVTLSSFVGSSLVYGCSFLGNGSVGFGLCRGGSRARHWAGKPYLQEFLTWVDPQLILTQVGFNDANEYTEVIPNSETFVDEWQSACNADIILHTPGTKGNDDYATDNLALNVKAQEVWEGFKLISDARSKVGAFNLNSAFPLWSIAQGYGLYTYGDDIDLVHPNPIGSAIQGQMTLFATTRI